jgi:hypothetical protein
LADLHDVWIACTPGHRDLPFSKSMARATLAEPFYRIMVASAQPG